MKEAEVQHKVTKTRKAIITQHKATKRAESKLQKLVAAKQMEDAIAADVARLASSLVRSEGTVL